MWTTFRPLFVLFLATSPVLADDRDKALAVIDRAVQAHGGESALTKAQLMTRSATGEMTLFDKAVPFKDEMAAQLPDRLRSFVDVGEGDQKVLVLLVINGDKGWQSAGGAVMELTKERLGELREEAYIMWLSTLAPLKKDTSFNLVPAPDVKINGRPAAGVKVSQKGHTDATLYFDKETGLLVKIARRAQEAGLMVDKEYLFSGHKEFEGAKLPTKQVEMINGKKFTEVTSFTYKILRRVDESMFTKP